MDWWIAQIAMLWKECHKFPRLTKRQKDGMVHNGRVPTNQMEREAKLAARRT